MEVLNSVLEHIINLYSRIENRETDIITKIQEYYLKAQKIQLFDSFVTIYGQITQFLFNTE